LARDLGVGEVDVDAADVGEPLIVVGDRDQGRLDLGDLAGAPRDPVGEQGGRRE
jgi:hypothetical protein